MVTIILPLGNLLRTTFLAYSISDLRLLRCITPVDAFEDWLPSRMCIGLTIGIFPNLGNGVTPVGLLFILRTAALVLASIRSSWLQIFARDALSTFGGDDRCCSEAAVLMDVGEGVMAAFDPVTAA